MARCDRLRDFLGSVKVGEPVFLRNLVIYPLESPEFGDFREFLTLEDGIFSISEFSPPVVERVKFQRLSDQPFFILDGEEILGAYQDRVVNTSLWLEGRETFELPVSCIEQKRWSGDGIFRAGLTLLNPSLRRVLCEGVSRSLSEGKGYKSDQRSLWSSIDETLRSLKISSKTSSFHDVYSSLREEIESYIEEVKDLGKSFSGFVVETPTLLAIDLFGNREMLSRFLKRLLRSYLIEGFIRKGSVAISANRIKGLLKLILKEEFNVYSTPANIGEELRFKEGSMFLGKALMLEDNLIHLSLFKVK